MRHPGSSWLPLAILLAVPCAHAAGTDAGVAHVDAFPELRVLPARADAGEQDPPGCAQIRARQIDELAPPWRDAVERIAFDCKDLSAEESGYDYATASTEVVAYLKPGRIRFAGLPVVEIRMKDSDLWGDHQFVIDQPFAQAWAALRRYMQATCGRSDEELDRSPPVHCQVEQDVARDGDSLYASTGELGGIWAHADETDPQRTVYADAWSD